MTYLFLFILGTAIGSFLNVLIDRLPNEQSISGRSYCDFCKKKLQWIDLFPVISFFLLKGKCRYCKKKLSWFYPLVESVTGVMFVLVWITLIPQSVETIHGLSLWNIIQIISLYGIISSLIVMFFTDAKYRIIPDSMQISLFVFSVFYIRTIHELSLQLVSERIIAAIVVAAPILFLYLITKGKGMGFGDVKLAPTIGFLLGLKSGLISLYIAFIAGALVGIILLLLKKKGLKSKIAFGPFLVIGIIVMLFFENKIFQIVKKIYGI
jgi:leader peptidase (prepilin peptidase)/N-methyltransferase